MSEARRSYDHGGTSSSGRGDLDLAEAWGVLKRRKLLVLGLTLAGTIAATAVVHLVPPTFESRVVIRIGEASGVRRSGAAGDSDARVVGQLEDMQTLVERLRQEYRVGERNPPNPLPRVESVRPADSRSLSGLVEIRAYARSPEEAQAFLKTVTDVLLRQHQKWFAAIVGIQREERERLEASAVAVQEEIVRFEKELERQSSRMNGGVSALVLLERARLRSELNAIRTEVARLDLLLSPVNTYETHVVVQPTLPVFPVKPKKVFVIVLASAVSLFVGVLLAFLLGFGRHTAGSA